MKIILVDDEEKFIDMLAKRLAMRGISADAVLSGDEAIKKITSTSYDVAVLDIKMPGISGLELKRKLSALDPDLKFIFVTGHGTINKSDEDIIEKDYYFSKPLDIEVLIKRLNEITNSG